MAGKQKQSVMGIENFVRSVYRVRRRCVYEMPNNIYYKILWNRAGGIWHSDIDTIPAPTCTNLVHNTLHNTTVFGVLILWPPS
jgi:hypothetical protein